VRDPVFARVRGWRDRSSDHADAVSG
jgi:hypothetical protein